MTTMEFLAAFSIGAGTMGAACLWWTCRCRRHQPKYQVRKSTEWPEFWKDGK